MDVPKRGRCSDSHLGLEVARVLTGACGSDAIVCHRNAYAQHSLQGKMAGVAYVNL